MSANQGQVLIAAALLVFHRQGLFRFLTARQGFAPE
jgi:hypothetical protein